MGPEVDRILEQRARGRSRGLRVTAIVAAVGLHSAIAVAVIALPRLRADEEPLEYVAVQVVPAAALGSPAAVPAPPAPEPEVAEPEPDEPAPPEPEPADEPEPEMPEPEPEVPELPAPRAAEPRDEPRRPPAPAARPPARPADQPSRPAPESGAPGRPGSPLGSVTGTSERLGAVLPGLDAQSFTYGYYIDQMLTQIERNWVRPPVQGIEATLHFRILRSGEITDIEVSRSSGSRSFDLAALRAVRNASPLPPLPSAYREPALAVNLIVR